VVHVQHAEERAYYALERLWKDCPTIPFVDSATPGGTAGAGRPATAENMSSDERTAGGTSSDEATTDR
jgi:ribosome-associated protein